MKIKSLLAMALFIAGSASATTLLYDLTVDGCTGGCGTGPFGTIQLDSFGSQVKVTATLSSGFFFVDNGTAHSSLTFNLDSGAAIDISQLTWNSPDLNEFFFPGDTTNSPFGTFSYGIGKNNSNDHCCTQISFLVGFHDGSTLTPNDFIANTGGYFFASDVYSSSTGNTGAVASVGPIPPQDLTPEPVTFILAGSGLLALGLARTRFKRSR